MRRVHRFALLTTIPAFIACSSEGDTAHAPKGPVGGTIVVSASADADVLLPPLTMTVLGKQVVDQVFDDLADVGPALNTVGDAGFTPRLSDRWSWASDSMSVSFHVNPRARWHDGFPVRADDIRSTVQLVKDTSLASPLASNLDNVDSVSVVDSLAARVWFHQRTPDAFFKIATLAILPGHLLKGAAPATLRESALARAPVGSGRFRFGAWDRSARIVLDADTANYRGRPNADRVIWLVSADYGAAALRFLGGNADFLDVVKPELVSQVKAKGGDLLVSPGSLDYGYVAFNLRNAGNSGPHPIFGDRETRRALAMAVDRTALVRSVFDTLALVAHGPATRILATSDTTLGVPYDPERASRALDSLGWRRGSDGMRSRAGKPLAFSLIVPSSSAVRQKVAVVLQEQWRKAGVALSIEPIEINTFGARMDTRKFETLLNGWHIDPTPSSVREEWTSSEIRKGGYNATSYRNPAFDAIIDSAVREMDPTRSAALYRRGYRILVEDAPAIWLYELRNAQAVSRRIHPVGIRPDAWWANLADWTVVKK